jgi:two-component system, LytTR family, sensor kinase
MKKSKDLASYIFAFCICVFSTITQDLLFKPGLALVFAVFFISLVGLWRLIEWLLLIPKNRLVKWGIVFLGSILYAVFVVTLDFYGLHLMMNFVAFSPIHFGINLFLCAVVSVILIESIKWTKAQEKAKLENLKLQAENVETQFNLLIQQVNPDFLFHSLTTLQKMVKADDPQSEEFILKLADVYRQTLKKERSAVSLREELAFFQSYLFLMMHGQKGAITFDITISDELLDCQLPVFSLQLLGENCIKHTFFSIEKPLHIQLFQKEAKRITISNNYQQKEIPMASFGVGLENLKLRYALAGMEDAVKIEQTETTYSVTIKLF